MSEFFRFFPKNRRFFAEIFLNDFSMVFSSPLQPITEKSPKYRPIFPIFSSLEIRLIMYQYFYISYFSFNSKNDIAIFGKI